MTVEQKEIVQALRAYDKAMGECGYELAVDKTVADRIEREGISPPEGYAIVPIVDCEDCDNSGVIRYMGGRTEPCYSCHEMLNSRFNQNQSTNQGEQDGTI